MSQITGPVFGIFGGQVNDGEQSWRIAMNNALLKLDATVSLSVINANQIQNPSNPSAGDRYIVAVGATGSFAGRDRQVAVYSYSPNGSYQSLGWIFYTPIDGLVAYETTTTYTWVYQTSTTSWVPKPVASTAFIIPNVGWVSGSSYTTADNSLVTVDSMSYGIFSSVKYTIQIKFQTHYQVSELLLTSSSNTAYITEYAKIISGTDLGSFDARINSGNIELRFQPTQNSAMTLRIMKTQIFI
jgi:hypothetical protein